MDVFELCEAVAAIGEQEGWNVLNVKVFDSEKKASKGTKEVI